MIGIVNHPAGKPEHLLLERSENLQILALVRTTRALGHRRLCATLFAVFGCDAGFLVRGFKHDFAGGRQIGKHRLPSWWARLSWRNDLVGEPEVQFLGTASVASGYRLLCTALRRIGRTSQPDMNVIVVAVPGPHLRHPGVRLIGLHAAQLLLDGGIDQHALDFELLRCGLDESDVLRCPRLRVETLPVRGNQIAGLNRVALLLAQHTVRHRHEPDVDVQAGLMTRMVRYRGPAAWLPQIADKDSVPEIG